MHNSLAPRAVGDGYGSAAQRDGHVPNEAAARRLAAPPYFHDGSAATLLNVVEHYDRILGLQLTTAQRTDLEQYLRSL